jgi:tRNA (cytidine/uridine-2'-O-)-methyltransferase
MQLYADWSNMRHINIVLCEPEIPQNTGNIARTCAATGASLHLIRPLGFEIDNAKLKRAGLDYWDKLDITFYDGLDDFYQKHPGITVYYFSTKAKYKYSDVKYDGDIYIKFGKETRGLPEELLYNNPETCVRIPMRDQLRSLNLSNSVAIAVYEILRQWDFEGMQESGELTKFTWDE